MIEILILIVVIAFFCEVIDSSLGMGYGTILSPLLIVFGFAPLLVVPSILITQAIGGLSASVFHHKYGNARFNVNTKSKNPLYICRKIKEHGIVKSLKIGLGNDLKIVFLITSLGIIATIIAALVAINISKTALSTYIGVLVFLMGLLIITNKTFIYSMKKMMAVGIISSFNKGLSGGGFGPVVTGGQMVLGQEHKKAIGCTTAAEFPICIAGFLVYLLTKGISDWSLIITLGIGALIAGPIGPLITKKINRKMLKVIVAVLMLTLGILTLLKTYGLIALKVSV